MKRPMGTSSILQGNKRKEKRKTEMQTYAQRQRKRNRHTERYTKTYVTHSGIETTRMDGLLAVRASPAKEVGRHGSYSSWDAADTEPGVLADGL